MTNSNSKNICSVAIGTAALLALATPPAHAATYTFTLLDTLGGNSEATGVNLNNQVAGISYVGEFARAVRWDRAAVTDLGTLGGQASMALGINDAGQVVGAAQDAAGRFIATSWATGSASASALGGGVNQAYAVNNAGQIAGSLDGHAVVWQNDLVRQLSLGTAAALNGVGQAVGTSTLSATQNQATRWDGDVATRLDLLAPGSSSYAFGINHWGQVVGQAGTSDGTTHAVVWNDTLAIDLGTLGGSFSSASAINDEGLIVGMSFTTGDAAAAAVLWDGNITTDLNNFLSVSDVDAGWRLYTATGINRIGSIVGAAYNSNTQLQRAYLLTENSAGEGPVTAVPEPQTYAMLLVGLGALGWAARRRRN